MDIPSPPDNYKDYLSPYKACLFDSYCGEPVAWGFKIIKYMSDEEFRELGLHGKLVCGRPENWFLITKQLTRSEAEEKYGAVTDEVFGVRGGWKTVTFGTTTFMSPQLKAPKFSST